MQPTPAHQTVEARFRDLIDAAGLALPDRVRYEPDGVVFLWDGPQVAVCVDFDDALTRAD